MAPPIANEKCEPIPYNVGGYQDFSSFYPYYLGEHSKKTNRRLHLAGTTVSLACLSRATLGLLPILLPAIKQLQALRLGDGTLRAILKLLVGGLLQGYVWAWLGHFFVEHNKPATFKHPFYSLRGDLQLWFEVVTLQRRP